MVLLIQLNEHRTAHCHMFLVASTFFMRDGRRSDNIIADGDRDFVM